ncbi:acyl carrier protein [Mobilisporobacter senegalensis]|uniref:Acyl carrier protein n=1 Tax=Mobilisporobacter senegalensis TaxID=1329262 RepID=A0A3N1XGU0_9FIRM|nr:phosphopantetheine-binding protein [Mobilisporobacter senegalensis]ROR25865.1 acyl carrier protein [Mobilisporobacter senegalensis]
MLEKLTTILQDYVKSNIPISEDAALVADLGLDSLDVFSLVTRIEEEFEVEVSERAIRKMVVVQDIMDYLDKNC